jgi:hypothetical protein
MLRVGGIFLPAEELSASQKNVCYMEIVNKIYKYVCLEGLSLRVHIIPQFYID